MTYIRYNVIDEDGSEWCPHRHRSEESTAACIDNMSKQFPGLRFNYVEMVIRHSVDW